MPYWGAILPKRGTPTPCYDRASAGPPTYRSAADAPMMRTASPSRVRTVRLGRSVVAHSDSYRYARWVLLMLLLVTVDVADFTDRSGSPKRYVILIFPL